MSQVSRGTIFRFGWPLAAVVWLAFTTPAWSAGFQLFNELSARAMGTGAAMTARTGLAEGAWFNPAATAFMGGTEALAGTAVVMPDLQLDGPGADYSMKKKGYPLPYFYAAGTVADGVGLGLAVNVPYGLTTEWDGTWPGRFNAVKTELRTVFVTPSVSYRVFDWLAVGAGAQVARADAELTNAISVTPFGEVENKIEGSDTGAGYLVSALVRPRQDWTLGVVYRSEVKLDLDGTATYRNVPGLLAPLFPRSDVGLVLRLPATVSLGLATTALEGWTLAVDAVWTRWSSYQSLDFEYEYTPGVGLPGVVSVPKDWHNVWALRLGAAYRLSPEWEVRGSYVYDKSPIDDTYRDPSLPTNDRHLFGLGVGFARGNLAVDAAYTYILVEDSAPSLVTPTLTGTYEGYANVVNLDVRWKF
ncbi:hypothetical protein G3N55_11600 [Dissulfurirhabdus thermomarina]|uniref:Transporter n=1 Tax=Dissulfurirhabdus thermomarina TaxID=1765737 RepID=A0A6N9TQC8_DISTH|nr:outer membrane protein transport protein [Dissulfurirhabdus thermomarina]NDY43481.1 hypothetical protein [Dissulfurirhabdus thermomarina]NMX23943.1 hypothetical protein [Dissulfurirhabdus thermomarina]